MTTSKKHRITGQKIRIYIIKDFKLAGREFFGGIFKK